ncbi:unnamed protein product [Heligmosomoides polygyrus]|uniref:DUF5753 domain-containing protein n=1 Tax=Heligmosomoides polygyrus TaxID=6339 RepID=A0A183GA21_HELPZ|nr:unnamed protein product [Heligmosomoides polygyrus]
MLLQPRKRSLLLLDTAVSVRVSERLDPEEGHLRTQQASGVRGDTVIVRREYASAYFARVTFAVQHEMLLQPRKRSLLLDAATIALVSERPDSQYV